MLLQDYQFQLETLQQGLLGFLRAFEREQEEIRFEAGRASQQRLGEAVGDFFSTRVPTFFSHQAPEGLGDFRARLSRAVVYCGDAFDAFQSAAGQTFNNFFLQSRLYLSKGLERLYALRFELPVLEPYWYSAAAYVDRNRLDPLIPASNQALGLQQRAATAEHASYSLYVPESYNEQRDWPLIVALHGGYGSGEEFIWTWMRAAKSGAYLLVAPKSLDVTWSVLEPPLDSDSIAAIITELSGTYKIDRRRVLLSGLSDGGSFAYLAAFDQPQLYSAVVPIAAELSQVADRKLREKSAHELPFYVIHGAHDHIFPIETVRSTCGLLEHLQYSLRFDELAEWGHAYPYQIIEKRVMPWFENLRADRVSEPSPG